MGGLAVKHFAVASGAKTFDSKLSVVSAFANTLKQINALTFRSLLRQNIPRSFCSQRLALPRLLVIRALKHSLAQT